nr:MAG TPA: hypothetical protein [Caudoviricetes sp.]
MYSSRHSRSRNYSVVVCKNQSFRARAFERGGE